MKKITSLLLIMIMSFSLVNVAFADGSSIESYMQIDYSKELADDAETIKYIEENIDKLLEEGKRATANDAKSELVELNNITTSSLNSLGSYGDILVSLIINSGSVGFAGHAGIVDYDSAQTIESFAKSFSPINKDGVQYYDNDWGNSSGALLIRPYGATTNQYYTAVDFSNEQVGKGYNWIFTDKKRTDKFYCSQLVWQAWLKAGIDTEKGSIPNAIIAPADLVNSSNTYIVKQVN